MTTYIEDIFSDSFTPNPISPVAADLLDGTLNSEESGPDSIDGINLQLIAGYTYTFSMLAPPATELYYIPGPDAAPIYATPVIDGPSNQLTFTAAASGVYTLFVESAEYVDYTIDVTAADAPVVVDPNIPTESNDTVYGTSDADNVALLGGDDRFVGGNGDDTVQGGTGRDILFGQNGDDSLVGDDGDDKMFGGNGDDTLIGGAGDDQLRGGNGADVFVFASGMNRDTLHDFEDGIDLLDFSAMGLFDMSQLTLTQVGIHVRINASPSDFVTVRKVDLADLTNDDFIFSDIFELT